MSFSIPDSTFDRMLEQVFENYATKLTICEGQPATYADATTAPATGNMLGEVVVDATDWVTFFIYASALGIPSIILITAIMIRGKEGTPGYAMGRAPQPPPAP